VSYRVLSIVALAAAIALPLAAGAQDAPAPQASGAPAAGWHGHQGGPGAWHGHRGGRGFRGHRHGDPLFHALHGLNLTAQQKEKIHAYARATRKADFAAMHANRQKFHAELLSVLTPAQREKLQTLEAKMKTRHAAWKKDHTAM